MLNPKPSAPVVLPEWFRNAVKLWEHRSEKIDPRFTHGMEALAVVRRCLLAEPKFNLQVRIHELELQLRECQQELISERELTLKAQRQLKVNPLTYLEQIQALKSTSDIARKAEQARLYKWHALLLDPNTPENVRLNRLSAEVLSRLDNILKQLIRSPLYADREKLNTRHEPTVRPAEPD